jgi:glycerophosphoryl diester phosphodiesterase
LKSRKRRYIYGSLFLIFLFVILNNCRLTPAKNTDRPELLAHRGLAQTFDISKVKSDTNTAAIIYPPEHPYIENTLPAIRAAFEYGADVVEFDIRVTKDKQLAVFHDYAVDARTERKGKVADFTLAQLKTMDVGFGYTHDDGKTFPLRGTGVGLLPSFEEVMTEFPHEKFLVHIRDAGEEIGHILLAKLQAMDQTQVENISIYGNDQAINTIKKVYPQMKALSANLMVRAILEYELIGWTGYVPSSIRNSELHMPLEYAQFLWGWPEKFIDRMRSVNTRMVLVKKQGPWSGGFDTELATRQFAIIADRATWKCSKH